MDYTIEATTKTPALLIFLIDVSASMDLPLGNKTRLEAAEEAVTATIQELLSMCMKGGTIKPRYRLAMLAYSDNVDDGLGGIQPIDTVVQLFSQRGPLRLKVGKGTNPAAAFAEAERLIRAELPKIQEHPAPVICHLTDGKHDKRYQDPEPIAQEIMSLGVQDGKVLVENIFISDDILAEPIRDLKSWQGIRPDTQLLNDYAVKLRNMSSRFPESYITNVFEKASIQLAPDARMLLPGTSPELVKLGFQIAGHTH
jgi:hypothetical protein